MTSMCAEFGLTFAFIISSHRKICDFSQLSQISNVDIIYKKEPTQVMMLISLSTNLSVGLDSQFQKKSHVLQKEGHKLCAKAQAKLVQGAQPRPFQKSHS